MIANVHFEPWQNMDRLPAKISGDTLVQLNQMRQKPVPGICLLGKIVVSEPNDLQLQLVTSH